MNSLYKTWWTDGNTIWSLNFNDGFRSEVNQGDNEFWLYYDSYFYWWLVDWSSKICKKTTSYSDNDAMNWSWWFFTR